MMTKEELFSNAAIKMIISGTRGMEVKHLWINVEIPYSRVFTVLKIIRMIRKYQNDLTNIIKNHTCLKPCCDVLLKRLTDVISGRVQVCHYL